MTIKLACFHNLSPGSLVQETFVWSYPLQRWQNQAFVYKLIFIFFTLLVISHTIVEIISVSRVFLRTRINYLAYYMYFISKFIMKGNKQKKTNGIQIVNKELLYFIYWFTLFLLIQTVSEKNFANTGCFRKNLTYLFANKIKTARSNS